jgi:hypothetical protein
MNRQPVQAANVTTDCERDDQKASDRIEMGTLNLPYACFDAPLEDQLDYMEIDGQYEIQPDQLTVGEVRV